MTRTVPRRRGVDLTEQASWLNEKASAKVEKRGLTAPDRPSFVLPKLPETITDLDDVSLLALFGELVAWADYASVQLAYAAIDEKAVDGLLEYHQATAMVRGSDSEKVTFARAQRDLDEDVQQMRQAAAEAYAVRKLTETVFNNLERDAALVSRELTRRTAGQAPATRRNQRWNT